MKNKPSIEHLEDRVILAYLDGELSRAATRRAKLHLQSCWRCRSAAAELEQLVQTASALLSTSDEADKARKEAANNEFLRRKARVDATWLRELKRSTSLFFQPPFASINSASAG